MIEQEERNNSSLASAAKSVDKKKKRARAGRTPKAKTKANANANANAGKGSSGKKIVIISDEKIKKNDSGRQRKGTGRKKPLRDWNERLSNDDIKSVFSSVSSISNNDDDRYLYQECGSLSNMC